MKKSILSLLPLLSLFSFIPTSSMNIVALHKDIKETIFLTCNEKTQNKLKRACKDLSACYKSMISEQKKYINALIASSKNTDLNYFNNLVTAQDKRFTDVRKSICTFLKCDDTIENNLKIYPNAKKAFPNIWENAMIQNSNLITYLCIKQHTGTPQDLISAFFKAAQYNFKDGILQLLDCGIDVNSVDDNDESALMITTCYYKGINIVKHLCSINGININQASKQGNTALINAAINGIVDIVTYLCSIDGIDINHSNKTNLTALTWAIAKNHTEVIEILKKAGAK